MFLKKSALILLALTLALSGAIAEEESGDLVQGMPAAGVQYTLPGDMEWLSGDEEGYDLGFRLTCDNEDLTVTEWVNDARDMTFADYAAFYADRNGMVAQADTLNGFEVYRLTFTDERADTAFTYLFAMAQEEYPPVVYSLSFDWSSEAGKTQALSILSTVEVWE